MRLARNLRHLRLFLAVAELGSPTAAAARCRVSQPAVTQAIARLERDAGGPLFERRRRGFVPGPRGRVLEARVRRALERLDAALAAVAPRLRLTATTPRLRALVAVVETGNFTLAAHALGLAQPTVHRAVSELEQEAGRRLFARTAAGLVPTRACADLAAAVRLAFAELDQAEADLAEFDGRDGGRVVIGALPLSRSFLLPEALVRFRALRPTQPVSVYDGRYGDLLQGLLRGEIDFLIGALRAPPPVPEVVEEVLFADRLVVLARPGHPLAGRPLVEPAELVAAPWVAPRAGTPARASFDAMFAGRGLPAPSSILECGSILLMRELLRQSDMLGCISEHQARAEIACGLLVRVPVADAWPERPIGLTLRAGWVPTRAQALMLELLRACAGVTRQG